MEIKGELMLALDQDGDLLQVVQEQLAVKL